VMLLASRVLPVPGGPSAATTRNTSTQLFEIDILQEVHNLL
jgi:hypothetical protein